MFSSSARFIDRDLSWLSFNECILSQAEDAKIPLYDRIKFLAIYSSNLDEFFRVRVAYLRSLQQLKTNLKHQTGLKPEFALKDIYATIDQHLIRYGKIFRDQLLPALAKEGIILYQEIPESESHKAFLLKFFRHKVLTFLQPTIVKEDGEMPFLENRALYYFVKLKRKSSGEISYAVVNIPSNHLDRFVELPAIEGKFYFIFLDDIVRLHLDKLFPMFEIMGCYSLKMNRDADLHIEDEYTGNLVNKIKKNLAKRNIGDPIRFLHDFRMPDDMVHFLIHKLQLQPDDVIEGGIYHNFNDFFKLPNPVKPRLAEPNWPSLDHHELDGFDSLFDALDKKEYLLHFPYQSYDYVLRLFNEAAIDPEVDEIMVTVYRIARESAIANALISAARNGKKVQVFVELKARFDEENNIRWAEELEKAGVKILYSIPGMKVHSKILLIFRNTDATTRKGYAYFGTGNFNEITARIYADHGFLTADQRLVEDLQKVFRFLKKRTEPPQTDHLLVAPSNLQNRFLQLIDREIAFAKEGKTAQIVIKINNLEDEVMINKLYDASQAGVRIDLIVRGICCLRPGIEGLSKNIRAIRIVDRYLEHARIFVFHNNGQNDTFLSSADWMKRNLYRRVEVGFPIWDEQLKAELIKILEFQVRDTISGRLLDGHLKNLPVADQDGKLVRSQEAIYQWLKEKETKKEV